MTLPHFSQGIVLHTKILVRNCGQGWVFLTHLICNDLLERRTTRERERERRTLDCLTLGDVESPALFLLDFTALDVAHNIVHSGAELGTLRPTVRPRLGPAVLLVGGGADLVRHGGADRLLHCLVLSLAVGRGGALRLLQGVADLGPGETLGGVLGEVLSLTLPVLHHPAVSGLTECLTNLLHSCQSE